MDEMEVPNLTSGFMKGGLEQGDLMLSIVLALGLAFLLKALGVPHLLAFIIGWAAWKYLITETLRTLRDIFPPKFAWHYLRWYFSKPVLRVTHDPEPIPLIVPNAR